MAKLLLSLILITGILCIVLARTNNPKTQRFVVEEGVYKASRMETLEPLPSKQCPEILNLESLVNFFERTRNWAVLVEVGNAYARGCYPFYGADPSTALQIYQLASRCPDRVVAAQALSRYADTRLHPISIKDRCGQPFPAEVARRLVRHAEYHIQRCPQTINRTRRQPTPTPTPALIPQVAANVVDPLALDKQNVHDHSISQTTRRNAKDIVVEGAEYDRLELLDSVMDELRKSKLKEKTLGDAFRVLVSLVPDRIESIGCSQLDVLNATKDKIDGVKDGSVKRNLFETLGKNLASGIERDHVVCSTGKIARIVSTLEGTSILKNKAVPIEVVRREIGQLASKIRNDVLSEVSQQQVDDYNSSALSGLSITMRERFEHEVDFIYIDGMGLSQKVLQPIIAMYCKEL